MNSHSNGNRLKCEMNGLYLAHTKKKHGRKAKKTTPQKENNVILNELMLPNITIFQTVQFDNSLSVVVAVAVVAVARKQFNTDK